MWCSVTLRAWEDFVPGCTRPSAAQCRDASSPVQCLWAVGPCDQLFLCWQNGPARPWQSRSFLPAQPGTEVFPPEVNKTDNILITSTDAQGMFLHRNQDYFNTLLFCISLFAPFLRSTMVASTLFTAAAQCSADLPAETKTRALDKVFFQHCIHRSTEL